MNWSMEEERSHLSREHNTSSDLESSQSDKQPLLNSSNSSSANLPGKTNAARDISSSWQRQGSPDDVAKTFPSSPASVSLDPQSSNLPQEKNPTHGSDSASSCNLLSPSSLPQTHKSVNKELAISSSSLHTQLNQYGKHHGHELIEPTDLELGSDLSELGKSTNYLLPHTTHYSGYTPAPGVPSEIKRARGRPRKERLSSASRQASTRGVSGKDQAHSFASRGLRRAVGRNIRRGGNRGSRQGRGHTRYSEALSVLSERHSPRNLLSPTQFLLNRLSPATKSGALRPPGMSDSMKQSINAPPFSGQDGNSNDGLSPTQGTCSGSSEIVVTPESQISGHLCALCNCGERSLLGQGDMWRFEPSLDFDVFKQPEPKSLRESEDVDTGGKNKGPQPTTWRRSRGPLKTGRERSRSPRQSTGEEDTSSCHNSDELALVGFHDDTELSQLFEPNGQVWVHHYCAMWSEGVHVTDAQLQDVDKAVYNALSHRCSYCRKFGASILCCVPDCGKRFHFPCASAGGCFQDAKTVSLLCPEHIDQAEDRAGEATTCIQCGDVGSIRDLLFCTSCGHHYHGSCFSPPVDMKPIVRAGWQCPNCKICQTCRTASDESKMLVCDKCDKGYHTFCLKPAMTTIPKNGWKCKNCRVCTDCESRTPGSGPSSRWHLNYSVCDSCYQQRNKGLCCPLCGKAYRHFHNKTMLPCMQCKKFVHIECDPTLNLESMSKLKDLPQDYVCTVCRETDPDAQMSEPIPSTVSEESMESYTTDNEMVLNNDPMLTEAAIIGPSGATGGLTASSSQDSLFMYDDSSSSFDVETPSDKSIMSPLHRRESSKKNRQKNKHSSERHHHHHHQQQQQTPQPLFQSQSLSEKRRGPKIKVKIGGQVMGITTLEAPSSPISHHSLSQTFSLSSPAYSAQSMDGLIEEKEKDKDKEKDDDDDDGDDHPSTLILADASDLFIMDQDMCKACGSFGKDGESKMIVCTQCGQCYHPYCVSVTVTKVMLQKGWRCLDCTVCEGCGGPYDEGRLLLCDDCDISYHTYCLDPPLETVPKGNWKCKWCVQCVNCGSTSPGFACQWMNNYTQCGPCHSKMYCPVCFDSYLTDQLIIQCQQCDRWLHCECDGLHGEDEAELAADYGYNCTFCRPKTGKEGPLPPPPPPPSPPKVERAPTPPSAPIVQPVAEPPRQFFVDGVYLFASGLNQIKQRLQVTNPKKLKPTQQRRASQLEEPEDSVLSGTMDQGQDEIGEDGVKKRKPRRVFGLGVGGFIVRQRSRQWLAKRQASYEEQEDPDKEPAGEKVEKPKRRRKVKKSKLEEAFPFYMQEAFFGKGILDQTQETTKGLLKNESDSEPDRSSPVKMLPVTDVCSVKLVNSDTESSTPAPTAAAGPVPRPHTSMSGSEQGEDIHSLDDLKEIMNEDLFSLIHDELKDEGLSLDGMDSVTTKDPVSSKTSEIPDNIAHMLSTVDKLDMAHIITEELANFDSKTVEDIFSGVLSESHPNSQTDANTPSDQFNMSIPSGIPGPGLTSTHRPGPHPGISSAPLGMRGPMGPQPGTSGLPPFGMPFTQNFQQPMNQRFSPGIGPAGPSMAPNSLPPWSMSDEDVGDSNKRTIMKWEQEEEMGDQATISCVLYVNMCHPDLKQKYPDWSERCKQIAKLWRKLTPEEKAPYLSKARKNRTSSRVQKAQKKKAALKSKNQVSQELQRRHEIQKQQDSEAMPPPPAPPPLANAEHYMDGSSPVMSPHPGPSHYQRLSWQDESKAPGTSSTPDHPGIQSDQVFSPPSGSLMTDPYAFPAPTPSDPFSQGQVRPPLVRPHRLPSVHAFGASSPREDEGLFTAPGMGQRVRPGSDMFTQGSPTPGQEMFMGGPRRIQGPRLNMPVTVDASNPLGDSNQPRPPGDPYSFPPSTPQTPVQQDDHFMPSGPLTPDPFHPARQRGDMFPMGSPQMRPPLTPTSHMTEPGQPYPGSPIRMPDFRHPLARSNSLPDPYSMPLGTPRPQMDPSMSHSDMGQDSIPMYRGNRMPMQMPEHQRPLESALRRNKLLPRSPWAFPFMLNYPDGGENPGNIHHQQLRVILGQQTKQRMAKKQEEAERMMTGPPTGWPDGPEVLEGFPPRPPFRGPSPQGFMRGTHPSMVPQGPRPPFYPGFIQRTPMPETYGTPPQEGIMTDQRSQYLQMLQERISESGSVPSASHLPTQHLNVMPYSPAPQPAPSLPPAPEPHANIARHLPAPAQQPAAEEEIFTSTETSQASTSTKANVPDDGTTVETDTLLEGIAEKTAKPSLSSEEDKNEDDDLLSADGTFDILKYADPDLDLDLDDKMFEHLDFIDESHTGDAKKSEDELKEETKDGKDLDGIKARNAAASDFQAQFLEFNQRHKTETKSEQDAAAEEKEKETEVGQIAAMLQGTESLTASSSVQDMKPSGLDSSISLNRPAAFLQNLASPHMQMSPNQGPAQTGSSGLPSPKIIHSPRSGQPSPRTPGIQSPFNTLLSGRHSASPHSQPMTPAGPQLSPFSAGSVQIPFSPPSSASQQAYSQGPGSAPHSPYPTTGQPPFGNMSSPGPPHMMSPGYPPSGLGPRPGGYNQMGHPAAPRMPPMYGQPPHGMRGHDGQPGRFPRPLDQGMEGIEGLGPRMPQPMSMQDGRPHPMYQNMQPRSMRGPPPPSSNHPGMSQMGIPHQRHQFPGQPPRLSHSPQVRGMSARQPGPPFPGGPPGAPQNTLLDELLEQEKEEQKRQAEQQALMHRRDGEQGMPSMSPGVPPVSGVGPTVHNMGGMQMRMDHPGLRMPGPGDGSGVWNAPTEGSPFQQGFSPRLMHPGMAQRSPVPFPGPADIRAPGPSSSGLPPGQQMPTGPPVPVSPPTGDMGPDYERQAAQYEEFLHKQNMYLESQVKTFEGQVNKLKRSKKTIQARQRLAKKNNQELNPMDTSELERISTEQSGLQKQLEAQRKLLRQHQHLTQDYKTKQQEQFGRMWTGGMAETTLSGSALPISHPRTPGGHNSVRLSPTARQEYEAYMQNRIRMANQQQQQQNRMRPPTTIIGDNNPFSEAFQQREQIKRTSMTPGPPSGPPTPVSAAPTAMPPPPGASSQPLRPPFNLSGANDSVASPSANGVTGNLTPTTPGPIVAVSSAPPAVSTTPGAPHTPTGLPPSPMSQPQSTGPSSTSHGPQGQPIPTPSPGPGTPGPRAEVIGALQFFRERNVPFEGSGGPRFPRPPGPAVVTGFSEGATTGPRLPPYPGNASIYPQGPSMESNRMPFQQGMPFQQAGPVPPTQIADLNAATQTVQKKKRKKKKKVDEIEGTQSQPLPPSLPNQGMIGQISGQVMNPSSMPTPAPPKPAELPRPQSETERRILEILTNSQKELQNPSSPSSARGGKSPRSRSPARAPLMHTSETDKSMSGLTPGLPLGGTTSAQTAESHALPQVSNNPDAYTAEKQRLQGDVKNTTVVVQTDSQSSTVSQTPMPAQSLPPHLQRMPMHPHGGPPMSSAFHNQQHIQHLQNLARMQQQQQQFQQQQFPGIPEGQRHSMDSQQIPPMGVPRYPQLHPYPQRQRFPPGVNQGGMPYQGRPPPPLRSGHPQYPVHMPQRVQLDPRMQGAEGHLTPTHNVMQQRMPGAPSVMSHSANQMSQGQHLQQINQAPPLSHMPSASSISQYQGTHLPGMPQLTPSISSVSTTSTASTTSSAAPVSTLPSQESLPQPTIPLVINTLQSSTAPVGSSITSMALSSSSSPAPVLSSSIPSETTTSSPSHIPPETNSQTQASVAQTTSAATSVVSIPASSLDSATSVKNVSLGENESDSVKKCEDGIHCGTDDEEESARVKRKNVCDDGIHCGTDDEEDIYQRKKKKVCDDGIHSGTDDEDDNSSSKKKVCSDGIHCGTDDEDDNSSHKKKVCDDGIHCGTDDEDDNSSHKKKVCSDGIHCGTDDKDDNSGNKEKVCSDGIHCGTDDEDDNSGNKKKVCSDGIHCGTDDEDDNSGYKKKVCDDGIHCGTDDEDDNSGYKKKVCDDGIHCGTDDEDDNSGYKKKVCSDGIHCGTDDEDDNSSNKKKVCDDNSSSKKKVCDDGIHCGTDDEDDNSRSKKKVCDDNSSSKKKVCSDGIHCGTDDEDDNSSNKKKVCDDGIHCGTDDEDDNSSNKKKVCDDNSSSKKKVCSDGIHCGTDDEDDNSSNKKKVCDDNSSNKKKVCDDNSSSKKKVCDDGIHCGTDDEDDNSSNKKKVCSDGIHCGTDDEDDNSSNKKKVCSDGIHCGTDDEDDNSSNKKKVCSDGIHCGTDDEDDKNVPPVLTHNLENFNKDNPDPSKLLDVKLSHSCSSPSLDLSSGGKSDSFAAIQASMSSHPLTPEKPAGTVVVTMLSPIDSEVSSKLAAVSQSLANFKPRIDPDESADVSIRPSDTLTALTFSSLATLATTVPSTSLSDQLSNLFTSGTAPSTMTNNKMEHYEQDLDLVHEKKVEVNLNLENCSGEVNKNDFDLTKVADNEPLYTSASQVIVSLSDTVRSNAKNSSSSSTVLITPVCNSLEQLPAPMSVTLSASSEPTTPISLPSISSPNVSKVSTSSSSQLLKSSSSNYLNIETSSNTISPSSGSRGNESRPVIPPIRIRMDGQSQPQVCESTSVPREGHRSEFSAVRNKMEGDLKLILRKSSDGTAELISGPFKDKIKRSRSDQDSKSSTTASVHSPSSGSTITSTATPAAVYSVRTLDLNSTPPTVSSHQTSSQHATPSSTSSSVSSHQTNIQHSVSTTEPFSSKPGSNLFKNVTYTKSPDTDIVKINVGSCKVTGEGTKKVIRSYTTDVQALERLQSTIDAVASGESSYEPDFDSEPPSRPSSQDSRSNSTPRPSSTSSASAAAVSTSAEVMPASSSSSSYTSSTPGGSCGPGMSPQHSQQLPPIGRMSQQQRPHVSSQQHVQQSGLQIQHSQQMQQPHPQPVQHSQSGQHSQAAQHPQTSQLTQPVQHPQTGQQSQAGHIQQGQHLQTGQHPQQGQTQHPSQATHPSHHAQSGQQHPLHHQQLSGGYMSQAGFSQHQSYPPPRITRPPLDLLHQVSQSALSSAGTAIPTSSSHQSQQEQRSPFMNERSPSAEHSPLHTSPHQQYTGLMGPRPMGSSPGLSPKAPSVQPSQQPYMPPQQQFSMQGGRFPSRMHDMPAAPPYGMAQHPMSPTGTSLHRQQRPPHFGMVGDMNRLARPPRGMPHPQHRPMPPEMMSPDHTGMRPRMGSHQFMSPTHPGMQDMPHSPHSMQQPPHGMPHGMSGMQQSPHPMQQSPHPMQQSSPHGMPQNSSHNMQRPQMMGQHHGMMQGGPPSPYPQTSMGVSGGPLASLANFHPPGHPGINSSMGAPIPSPHHRPPQMFNQMGNQHRMVAPGSDMQSHYRHMMMRGIAPPSSTPPSQMSPHLSPQMSPNMTQPLRHLDNLQDDKNFVTNLPSGSAMAMPGLGNDHVMNMGTNKRPFNPSLHLESSGFMSIHQPVHMMVPNESMLMSRSSLSSPMSDSCVKLEPSEDSASADGSISKDDLDMESKTPHNELLKQLLGTGQNGRQLPTPDSEDSLPSLTPEQQRQLEMIDSMPLCKETEISTPEWEAKTPEEKEKIMEMRKQEYEQKRQEYEVSRKNKRKTLTGTPVTPSEKKKRKSKLVAEEGVEVPKKKLKKSKLKESQIKELEAQAETFLQQLHNMPPIQLQEPIIATTMSILPVKGATTLSGISSLKGRFCSAYLENIEDMYGSLLFPQPPPGLRPTVPSAETLAQRQLANEAKIRMMQDLDAMQMLKTKEGIQTPRPGPRNSPRLILPPQPRIEIKSEQMRERKEERETPDTIVSSSSPEFGFNEQEADYPGLRPIHPATSNDIKLEDTTSPVVPLIHPLPFKPAISLKDPPSMDVAIKHEFGLMKHDSPEFDIGLAGPSASMEQPCRDLTVNLPNLTSGLAQPFLDPALDQQVSVTLTLSTGAAQDIGAVISAIADLLKIAVPPTYEITRSPSPEMFRMSLTHKEEAVNIHTLMSTRPRFCQHCDVFVLCSGIAKYKREFPILLEQDADCGDDEMIFCSMNCSMQFSAALEARQRQAQLRIKDESGPSTSQSPPPCGVKLEISSGALTPNSATVSSNVDEVIAAVAADTSLSPDTPGDMSVSPGTPSTTPTSPFSAISPYKAGKRHRRSSSQISDSTYSKPLIKKWRGLRWKRGNQELLDSIMKLPSTPVHELDKLWQSLGMIHRPKPDILDTRKCLFCQNVGDGDSDGPSRLLNVDINKWVHLNCALWSYEVYETLNGALMNVDMALQRSSTRECASCHKMGATLPCFRNRCTNAYHLPCARQKGCMFYGDKTMLCASHIPKNLLGNEMTTLVVRRRVYINRDEDKQVASMFHQEDGHCCLRIGSLILHSIGQLLPHQILCGKFNTKEYIYPVGFKTSRFYWSYYSLYQRCRYICSIHDNDGEPEFRIQVVDINHDELVFKDNSPAAVWMHILKPLERMRREADLVKMFPSFKAAEDLFGLTDPNIVKVLESLPGTDLLQSYNFKYGRSPLIEMPPAINPTGCARTEPKLRTHFRRPHTLQSTNSRSLPSTVTGVSGDINSPYMKQFVHSKSQQYRRLKTDWKSLVYLGRSRIQGLGLYAARDLEKHTMVIEYIGDLIRNEVANRREKEYESQNRGVYMFRIDNDVVIDATMAGGPARYINHSCNPNCVAEVVDIEKESKIIIITSRKIVKGEELTYDYKFDFEDDQHKIPCMCGAVNCRKWMN